MKIHKGLFPAAWLLLCATLPYAATLSAEENASAVGYARQATEAFRQGDFNKSAKNWEKAVQLDSRNPDYRDGLGKAYERKAEQASFPLFLGGKARESFLRALELRPDHAGAMKDLIELAAQPVGLCEGDLEEASILIDRLAKVDPQAAKRQHLYWLDAVREANRPGQKALCGPVKLSRVVTNRLVSGGTLKVQIPNADGQVVAETAVPAAPQAQ